MDGRNAYDRCDLGISIIDQLGQVKYFEFDIPVQSQVRQDVLRRHGRSFDGFQTVPLR